MNHRVRILLAGIVAQLPFAIAQLGMPAMLPVMRDQYALGPTGVGIALSTVTVGFFLGVLPWGVAADIVGERTVVLAGSLGVAVVMSIAAAGANHASIALPALVLCGLFGSCAPAASAKAVRAAFPPHQRGRALAIRHASLPLGGLLGALLFPLLVDAGGLGAAYLLPAAAALLAAAATLAWLPRVDHGPDGRPALGTHLRGAVLGASHGVRRVSVGCSMLNATQFSLLGFMALYLKDVRGWSLHGAALLLATLQLGAVAGRPLLGWHSDRVRSRLRPLREVAAVLVPLMALTAALIAAHSVLAAPALLAAGIIASSWNGVGVAAVAELAGPGMDGAAIGIQTTALSFTASLTPPLFATFAHHAGWAIAYGCVTAFPALGWLVLGTIRAPGVPLQGQERVRRVPVEDHLL